MVLYAMIEHLIAHKYERFDLGVGDERYKRSNMIIIALFLARKEMDFRTMNTYIQSIVDKLVRFMR